MISDTKVVAIGGGTGLSTMLKGLKLHTHNITAVVTVADDGGSSGILRSDLGMLAPGDVRNCVSALAEVDPVMGELLNFRFKDGSLKGHSLGNLFLAALNETSSSFDEAVKKFSHLTGVVGTVYPVTNESVTLSALLEDGRLIEGESHIGVHHDGPKNGIVKLMVNPEKPKAVASSPMPLQREATWPSLPSHPPSSRPQPPPHRLRARSLPWAMSRPATLLSAMSRATASPPTRRTLRAAGPLRTFTSRASPTARQAWTALLTKRRPWLSDARRLALRPTRRTPMPSTTSTPTAM